MEPTNDIKDSAMGDHQPSSSEPLLKQVFSQEYLNWVFLGPAGICWGLARSGLDTVYWGFQLILCSAFVATFRAPVEDPQDAKELRWIIAVCVLTQILFWLARAFRIHQKQQQEGQLTLGRCFLHALLEYALMLVFMFFVTRMDLLRRQVVVDDKNPTWKDFGFYYAIVAVAHLGSYLTISQAWTGALQLQSLQLPRLKEFLAILVHCFCYMQLMVALFQLMGWTFRFQLSTLFLLPLNYILFMASLYANVMQNVAYSGHPQSSATSMV